MIPDPLGCGGKTERASLLTRMAMADETSSDLCFGGKSSLSFPWGWHQTDITIKVQSLKSDSEAHATDIRLKFSAPNYLKSRELRGKHFSLMCVSFEISYHEKKNQSRNGKNGKFSGQKQEQKMLLCGVK